MTESATTADCLTFASEALIARGALVEPSEAAALAVLPAELAAELSIPETAFLTVEAALGDEATPAVAVGFGAPLLERLVDWSRAGAPVAGCRLDLDAPRPSHARRLAERFVVRNGLSEVVGITAGRAGYWLAWLAWTAECDERYEGMIRLALAEADAAEPDGALLSLSDPLGPPGRFVPDAVAEDAGLAVRRLSRAIAARAQSSIAGPLAPIVASVERRKRRDHERVAQYFAELAADAVRSRRRGRVDPAALGQKLRHFAAERDAKLRDLDARFALRVSIVPAALLRVDVETVHVALRLRRRKAERELRVRLPAGVGTLDRPACEACLEPTAALALCDERLHLLCASCAPDARGRIACRACGG